MLQEHLLIAAVVCRGLSALTAPGVVGTIQAPRVCQGSFGMNKGAHSVYASGLSLPRVAAVARRGDGVVVWGSPGSHGWTPQQSPNNSERSSNALLVNIRRNERNRTHANEQKRLGGTKSRATESCGVYPTRATAGETATVAADADRFAEASVSTRVLNEGVSSGATADDRCINNNTTRNGYSLRSSNRCLSSAYTNSGGTSRSTSNNSCGIMGPLNVVSTAEEGDILRGLKVRSQLINILLELGRQSSVVQDPLVPLRIGLCVWYICLSMFVYACVSGPAHLPLPPLLHLTSSLPAHPFALGCSCAYLYIFDAVSFCLAVGHCLSSYLPLTLTVRVYLCVDVGVGVCGCVAIFGVAFVLLVFCAVYLVAIFSPSVFLYFPVRI